MIPQSQSLPASPLPSPCSFPLCKPRQRRALGGKTALFLQLHAERVPARLQLLTLLQPEPGGSGAAWVAAALRMCEVSCPQPHVLASRMLLVPAWCWLRGPMPRADVVPREHRVVLSDLGREGSVWAGKIHVQSNTVTAVPLPWGGSTIFGDLQLPPPAPTS